MFLKAMRRMIGGNNNVFRECPYTPGSYFVTIKRMAIDSLNFGQILPSGRYSFEFTLTDGFNVTNLIFFKPYILVFLIEELNSFETKKKKSRNRY